MTVRTSNKQITFRAPFVLSGLSGAQPAGVYEIEVEEELLDSMSLQAYRRTSTMIELRARPGNAAITEMVMIDPDELEAALARDRAEEGEATTAPVHAECAS